MSKFNITIVNELPQYNINEFTLKAAAKEILNDEKIKTGWLNIILIGDKLTKTLNKRYLDKDTTTDVLSFFFEKDKKTGLLEGEVYANLEQIKRQAKDYKVDFHTELARVVIHGILHLVGYDDQTESDRREMTEKEDFYLG